MYYPYLFYFLQKFIEVDSLQEIRYTTVYPSARTSDRVPRIHSSIGKVSLSSHGHGRSYGLKSERMACPSHCMDEIPKMKFILDDSIPFSLSKWIKVVFIINGNRIASRVVFKIIIDHLEIILSYCAVTIQAKHGAVLTEQAGSFIQYDLSSPSYSTLWIR